MKEFILFIIALFTFNLLAGVVMITTGKIGTRTTMTVIIELFMSAIIIGLAAAALQS